MRMRGYKARAQETSRGTSLVRASGRLAGKWRDSSLLRWQNFVLPCKRGCFLERRGDRAILLLAQFDGALHGRFIERAAEAVEHFKLGPYLGRFRSALSGTNDLQRFELLAFFLEDAHHVGAGAGPQGEQKQFHRPGPLVGYAAGIKRDGMPGGTCGHKLFFANPFYGCCFHFASGKFLASQGNHKKDNRERFVLALRGPALRFRIRPPEMRLGWVPWQEDTTEEIYAR